MRTRSDQVPITDELDPIPVAKGHNVDNLLPGMANSHGLITGATRTGKTVTLRVLAEQFSRIRAPVFYGRYQGDLSGMARPGGDSPKILERASELGLDQFPFEGYPVTFWDVYGEQGHPVRTTVSKMGPLLLARILNLNDIQTDVLSALFKVADDQELLQLDLKDLRSMTMYIRDHAKELRSCYGDVSPASIGAIQRSLLTLEQQGAERFFGEPALQVTDFARVDPNGHGMINILAANRLVQSPKTYAALLLWLISELFEQFPEAGDPPKPIPVFFFDEAHLLFAGTPNALTKKIVQIVRLIRSKVSVSVSSPRTHSTFRTWCSAAGEPCASCTPGIHPERPEGGQRGCTDVTGQPWL